MCVVSAVGDHYQKQWEPYRDIIQPDWRIPARQIPVDYISREEFEQLKLEVEECKRLLEMAKEIDEKTGQPDCEMEEKIAFLKKVAEYVGVPLEIFK